MYLGTVGAMFRSPGQPVRKSDENRGPNPYAPPYAPNPRLGPRNQCRGDVTLINTVSRGCVFDINIFDEEDMNPSRIQIRKKLYCRAWLK